MGTNEIACPSCSSQDTQKASIIYELGTYDVRTRTSGVSIGLIKGEFAPIVTSATTTGQHRTKLADRLAPPAQHDLGRILISGIVLAVIAGFLCQFIFMKAVDTKSFAVFKIVAGGLIVMLLAHLAECSRYNSEDWPGLYSHWDQQWYCLRCGVSFVPGGWGIDQQEAPAAETPIQTEQPSDEWVPWWR